MVLLDTRAYTIKYIATRKRDEKVEKLDMQIRLDDAIRLLELDNRHSETHTNKLIDNVKY